MSYIGQQPLNNFVTKQSQTFSPDGSTTAFTLNFSVTSGVDIMLVINNVVQEPGGGKAYTASGTTLTMSEAPGASDSMYCIFLGLALQTVNPGDGSVGTAKLVDSAVTNAKIANSTIDLTSKVTGVLPAANGQTNTPSFFSTNGSAQTISTGTLTKIEYPTEVIDTDSAFASNKFTVPSGKAGKYFFSGGFKIGDATDFNELRAVIYKNGSALYNTNQANHHYESAIVTAVLDLSVSDYVEIYGYHSKGSNADTIADSNSNYFMGFKLI